MKVAGICQRTLTVALFLAAAAATTQAADISAASRIDSVTVYPSGAEVTRRGSVELPAGETTLVFPDLPAEAVPGSVRFEAEAGAVLRIGSVNQRRLFVPQSGGDADGSQRQAIEDEIEALRDERSLVEGRIAAANAQGTLLQNLANLPNTTPSGGQAPTAQPDWTRILGLIGVGTNEVRKTIHDAQLEIRVIDEKLRDLEKKLEELAPKRVERTEVKVFASADAATTADFTVRYQVRTASWTPTYEARLDTGGKSQSAKLELVRRGAIQQRTGEDWQDVEIRLSTARPSAGTTAPELRPLLVDIARPPRPSPRVTAMQEAAPAAPAMEADRGFAKNRMRGRIAAAPAPAKPVTAKVEAAPFQATYVVPGRTAIPANGEEKTLVITADDIEAKLRVKSVPKQQAKAYLYATFTYQGDSPLLPGKVSLFRDGSFAGSGRLPLIAGAEHELGFGADDLVKVEHRIVQEKRGETGLISTTNTDDRNYELTIENLHKQPVDVTVLDQIPVSRNEKVAVELTGKTPPDERNVDGKRGLVAWKFPLTPGAKKTIDFGYTVRWPAENDIVYRRR